LVPARAAGDSEATTMRSCSSLLTLLFAASPALGQTLTTAIGANPPTLDPQLTFNGFSFHVTNQVYETLVRVTPDGDVVAGLATDWSYPDPTTLRFTLREGVTFHDGTPFDADAVVASLTRILDPATAAPGRFVLSAIGEVRAVDAATVEIVTDPPFAPLLSHLAHPVAAIVPVADGRDLGRAAGRHRPLHVRALGGRQRGRPRRQRRLLGRRPGDRRGRGPDHPRGQHPDRRAALRRRRHDLQRAARQLPDAGRGPRHRGRRHRRLEQHAPDPQRDQPEAGRPARAAGARPRHRQGADRRGAAARPGQARRRADPRHGALRRRPRGALPLRPGGRAGAARRGRREGLALRLDLYQNPDLEAVAQVLQFAFEEIGVDLEIRVQDFSAYTEAVQATTSSSR
jgi:peptide/nickel transport system substrate-binding protein